MKVRPTTSGQFYELCGPDSAALTQGNGFLAAVAARGLAAMTVRAYAYDLAVCTKWLVETGRTVDELEQANLLEFMTAEHDRGMRPRSINRRLTTLEAFYRFVTGQSIPCGKGVSSAAPYYRGRGYDRRIGVFSISSSGQRALRVKVPRKLVDPLNAAQVNAFIKTLRYYRDLALVYLMLFCGLRSHEVLTLSMSDLNVDTNSILINGKGTKQRTVPLPPVVRKVLLGYLRCERPLLSTTARIFVIMKGPRVGCPMTLAGLRSLFRHRRQQSMLSNANAHRFRHTFGADMARAGVGLSALQKLMGHNDAETTLRYINLSLADVADEYRRASARIEARYRT